MKLFRTLAVLLVGMLGVATSPAEAQYQLITTNDVAKVAGDHELSGDLITILCAPARSVALHPDGQGAPYTASAGNQVVSGGPALFSTDYVWTSNHNSILTRCPDEPPAGLFVGGNPGIVAFAADGRRMYVVDRDTNLLTVVDSITNRIERNGVTGLPVSFDTGYVDSDTQQWVPGQRLVHAAGLAISPDGKWLFIPSTDPLMSVLDATTLQQVALVNTVEPTSTQFGTTTIALKWTTNPADRKIYLVGASGALAVYSGVTYEPLPTPRPTGQAVVTSPDGSRAYLGGANTIRVIDTTTNTVVSTVQSGGAAMAITGDGRYLYTSSNGGSLTAVVLATNAASTVFGIEIEGWTLELPVYEANGGMTIAVGRLPFASFDAVGSITTVTGVPFSLSGSLSLGAGNNAIDPVHEAVTLALGGRILFLPVGSFEASGAGAFHFSGSLDTNAGVVTLDMEIHQVSGDTYAFTASGTGINTFGDQESIRTMLLIGDDGGTTAGVLSAGYTQTIAGLQTQLSASQGLTSSLQSQNDVLVQANATLTHQVDALTAEVQTLTAQVQPLTDQVQALTTINQSLTTENVQLTANTAQLTTANAGLTAANAGLTTANAGLSTANATLQTSLSAAQTTIATSHARIEHLETRGTNLQARIDTLETHLATARGNVEELRSKLADARDRIDALQAKLDNAKATEADLRQQIAQLQQDLKDAKKKK